MAVGSHHGRVHGLVVCRSTTGGTSPGCAHSSGGPAARVGASVLPSHSRRGQGGLPAWSWGSRGRKRRRWGETQAAASESGKTYSGKTSVVASARGLQWLCWPLVSSVAKAAGPSAGQTTGNSGCSCSVPDAREPWTSSRFPGLSLHLSLVLLGGVKPSCVPVQCPRKVGRWPLTLPPPSQGGEHFLAGKFILDAEQSRPGVGRHRRVKLSFLPFLCSSQTLCSTVLLAFLKQTPELSQRCFCSWMLSNHCSSSGDRSWGLLCHPFGRECL